MRLLPEHFSPSLLRACVRSVAAACAVASACSGHAQVPSQPPSAEPLTARVAAPPVHSVASVDAAVGRLRLDPDLSGKEFTHELRLKHARDDDTPPDDAQSLGWLSGLARWMANSGRALVWALGIVAVAFVLVSLRRWWQWRAEAAGDGATALPSHVRDLDIRPESLPDDVGAAARALWQAGEARAALSLLYRGALSRLVHGHRVPIRAASTEGECARLAARALPAEGSAYFTRLVQCWQSLVYAGRRPDDETVLALCADHDRCLGSAVTITPLPKEAR